MTASSKETSHKRARELGIPLEGTPGPYNAITDVDEITVGHTTLISGNGKLQTGKGPVRTGVTAILPRGQVYDPVFAATFSLNGNGEMTGMAWIEESGFLEGPIMITNTHSVGLVRDAVIDWQARKGHYFPITEGDEAFWALPVVGETYDGILNDINGFHVKKEHVNQALESATGGVVTEGAVGGGTGMICHLFKGGIGTSSRKIVVNDITYHLGILVQANYGTRKSLTISGMRVGNDFPDLMPEGAVFDDAHDRGSIIVIVATNAPLLPHQLKRIARRVPMGLARLGSYSGNDSGDIFLAFSTANPGVALRNSTKTVRMISNEQMSPFFEATVQATEEAILNALLAGIDMTGKNDTKVYGLPGEKLLEIIRQKGGWPAG